MRVGLLADTHDRVPAVAEFVRRFAAAGVAHVLHAGDYCSPFALRPLREAGLRLTGVLGRNDGDPDGLRAAAARLPEGSAIHAAPHALVLAGTPILLVHDLGATPVRSVEAQAVVVHGCAHRAGVRDQRGARGPVLLVNPGEGCGWLAGTPGAAILDLATRRVEFLTLTDPEWRA